MALVREAVHAERPRGPRGSRGPRVRYAPERRALPRARARRGPTSLEEVIESRADVRLARAARERGRSAHRAPSRGAPPRRHQAGQRDRRPGRHGHARRSRARDAVARGRRARAGLTPKYAAPELLLGEPLHRARARFTRSARRWDASLDRRGDLDRPERCGARQIASARRRQNRKARYPSVDELGSALKSAAKLEPRRAQRAAWPVLGADAAAQALATASRLASHQRPRARDRRSAALRPEHPRQPALVVARRQRRGPGREHRRRSDDGP